MHAMLRDRYHFRARFSEATLLVCSTVFCATTFADDAVIAALGIGSLSGRIVLGMASVIAFATSLLLLLFDLKGAAARHAGAVQRWSVVLSRFREARRDDGTWADDDLQRLHDEYWRANDVVVEIPDADFLPLKSKYLMKVEVSRLKDRYPGAPTALLRLKLRSRSFVHVLKAKRDELLESGDDRS